MMLGEVACHFFFTWRSLRLFQIKSRLATSPVRCLTSKIRNNSISGDGARTDYPLRSQNSSA